MIERIIYGECPTRVYITFEELSSRIHPEDLDKVRASFAATRDLVGTYETDFRILHGDEVRWISARGRGDDRASSAGSCSEYFSM